MLLLSVNLVLWDRIAHIGCLSARLQLVLFYSQVFMSLGRKDGNVLFLRRTQHILGVKWKASRNRFLYRIGQHRGLLELKNTHKITIYTQY